MITVTFVSPSAVTYNVAQTTAVMTDTVPSGLTTQGGLTPQEFGMRYFGIIIAASVPVALMRIQGEQTVQTSWKLIVSDGKDTYEFTKVWFSAHDYPASGEVGKVRIDFGSQTGPSRLKLISPQ